MRTRPAHPDDATTIAAVHVATWRTAYRGLVDDGHLDGLSLGEFEERWTRNLVAGGPRRTWVAESDGAVSGFACAGPTRDEDGDRARTGEVYAIYVLPRAWGTGVGRALLAEAFAGLHTDGRAEATLWVLVANARARRLYEAAGMRPDGAVERVRLGPAELPGVRYRVGLPVRVP